VHIRMEKGSLSSDRADVTFANNQIARAVINGAPANFEQTLEQPSQIARGRANVIEYDVRNGTVRLAENAWLSDGEVRAERRHPRLRHPRRTRRRQLARDERRPRPYHDPAHPQAGCGARGSQAMSQLTGYGAGEKLQVPPGSARPVARCCER